MFQKFRNNKEMDSLTLKLEQVQNGRNPFDEIHCCLCENNQFVSIDHASVWCSHCNAQFFVRHTSGDPGYVVDCFTKWVWKDSTKHEVLIGKEPTCIVKEENPRWVVFEESERKVINVLQIINGRKS